MDNYLSVYFYLFIVENTSLMLKPRYANQQKVYYYSECFNTLMGNDGNTIDGNTIDVSKYIQNKTYN